MTLERLTCGTVIGIDKHSMREMTDLDIRLTDPESPIAQQLLQELDNELWQRYPKSSVYGIQPEQLKRDRSGFIVAYCNQEAVGCGAIHSLDAKTAEMKRVYVRSTARGQGIAKQLVSQLETLARQFQFHTIRLETGTEQPEAIALYEALGYQKIPCFDIYATDPYSLCYEKVLVAQETME